MANPLGSFWARLTPRERSYIMVLALVFFVMGTVVLLFLRSRALSKTRDEIDAVQGALEQVYTRGAVYEARLQAKKAREANIPSKPVLFTTLLEQAKVGIEDIDVADEEPQTPVPLEDGMVKKTFKFELRGNLESVIKFLTALESEKDRIILTESLLIRSHNPTVDQLNVDVIIATWERPDDAEGAEQEEE